MTPQLPHGSAALGFVLEHKTIGNIVLQTFDGERDERLNAKKKKEKKVGKIRSSFKLSKNNDRIYCILHLKEIKQTSFFVTSDLL